MANALDTKAIGNTSKFSNGCWSLEGANEVIPARRDREAGTRVPDDRKGALFANSSLCRSVQLKGSAKRDCSRQEMIWEVGIGDVRGDKGWRQMLSLGHGEVRVTGAGSKLVVARARAAAIPITEAFLLVVIRFRCDGTRKGARLGLVGLATAAVTFSLSNSGRDALEFDLSSKVL